MEKIKLGIIGTGQIIHDAYLPIMPFLKNIGTTEIVVVALLVVILFGGKKIPEFVRGLADAVKEFKKGSKDKTE